MQALTDFLTTDYGLMSAAVILFVIGMATHFVWYVTTHVRQDSERHERMLRGAARHDATPEQAP